MVKGSGLWAFVACELMKEQSPGLTQTQQLAGNRIHMLAEHFKTMRANPQDPWT